MTVNDPFSRALSLIIDLKNRDEVFVGLKPPFGVTFEVSHDVLTPALEAVALSDEEFRSASSEIGDMLMALLQKSTESFVDGQIDHSAPPDIQQRHQTETRQRIESVRELADAALQQRFNLKIASKASSFSSIDWDVKTKTFDARLGAVRIPYATVKIRWQREFENEVETFLARDLFESAQINMTADEVNYLIKEFRRIQAHILAEGENQ